MNDLLRLNLKKFDNKKTQNLITPPMEINGLLYAWLNFQKLDPRNVYLHFSRLKARRKIDFLMRYNLSTRIQYSAFTRSVCGKVKLNRR